MCLVLDWCRNILQSEKSENEALSETIDEIEENLAEEVEKLSVKEFPDLKADC